MYVTAIRKSSLLDECVAFVDKCDKSVGYVFLVCGIFEMIRVYSFMLQHFSEQNNLATSSGYPLHHCQN